MFRNIWYINNVYYPVLLSICDVFISASAIYIVHIFKTVKKINRLHHTFRSQRFQKDLIELKSRLWLSSKFNELTTKFLKNIYYSTKLLNIAKNKVLLDLSSF